MKKFVRGFGFAFKGLHYAFTTQVNFRFHVFAALAAIAAGFYLRIDGGEWKWVLLCIAMVLLTELLNTAIELLTDLTSPGYNKLAGHIKDVSAAAVLIMTIFAAATGAIIFLPKILALLVHAA